MNIGTFNIIVTIINLLIIIGIPIGVIILIIKIIKRQKKIKLELESLKKRVEMLENKK